PDPKPRTPPRPPRNRQSDSPPHRLACRLRQLVRRPPPRVAAVREASPRSGDNTPPQAAGTCDPTRLRRGPSRRRGPRSVLLDCRTFASRARSSPLLLPPQDVHRTMPWLSALGCTPSDAVGGSRAILLLPPDALAVPARRLPREVRLGVD